MDVNQFTHAVVTDLDTLMIPVDKLPALIDVIGSAQPVEYNWNTSSYKYKSNSDRHRGLSVKFLCVSDVAQIALGSDNTGS